MNTLLFLLLVLVNACMANDNVDQARSSICVPTQKAINMNHECSEYKAFTDKIQCVATFDRLNDLKEDENDEFNYVKLFKKTVMSKLFIKLKLNPLTSKLYV